MTFNAEDPTTWPYIRPPLFIAHDVAGSGRDRSTAVIGGNGPFEPRLLGIIEAHELPSGLYGCARASALAAIDRQHDCEGLIVADLSNDQSYAEVLYETLGRRVVGLHIARSGNGLEADRLNVKNGVMFLYTIGRSYLLELFHSELHAQRVRMVNDPTIQRAYDQLVNLETEMRESGIVYGCPPGQHDDLGISLAMLAWAARHPDLTTWVQNMNFGRRIIRRSPSRPMSALGWT